MLGSICPTSSSDDNFGRYFLTVDSLPHCLIVCPKTREFAKERAIPASPFAIYAKINPFIVDLASKPESRSHNALKNVLLSS